MRYLIALLAIVSTSLVPTVSEACSCSWDQYAYPSDGDTEVPTNARIWLLGEPAAQIDDGLQVLTSGGTSISGTVTRLADKMVVFTPDELLEPLETYTIDDPSGNGFTSTFTVGTQEQTTTPEVPGLRVEDVNVDVDSGSSCGDSFWASLAVDDQGLITVLDVVGEGTFEGDLNSGTVADVYARDEGYVGFGKSSCRTNWRRAGQNTEAKVRVGTLNLSGEFSGWSEPQHIRFGRGSGCSTTSSPKGGLAFGLIVAALACYRRRQ